jgi:hypothetical protein
VKKSTHIGIPITLYDPIKEESGLNCQETDNSDKLNQESGPYYSCSN